MKKLLFLGAPFDYYKGGAEYQYMILEQYLNEKYEIYHFFAKDPEGRAVEFQKFLQI